jgi:predicted GIY-YIG superfamily endonuclease/isopentenyldiphosphate isomerase
MKKPNNYWTFDKCQQEALNYNTKIDFKNNSRSAYKKALINNWLSQICSHMIIKRHHNGFWTKERCQEEALKYNTKNEFKKNSKSSYAISLKNNWINDICSHMILNNDWTFENCKKEALKYKTKSEFYILSNSAYNSAYRNNWLNEICSHMPIVGNKMRRMVYVVIFHDKHAYVGLTYNFEQRINQHLTSYKSSVFKYIKKTKLKPRFFKLTQYINLDDAIKYEEIYLNKFKERNYIMINIAKTGSVGGNNIKWTFKNCKNESTKYNSRSEFKNKSGSAYASALKNKWLDIFYPKIT